MRGRRPKSWLNSSWSPARIDTSCFKLEMKAIVPKTAGCDHRGNKYKPFIKIGVGFRLLDVRALSVDDLSIADCAVEMTLIESHTNDFYFLWKVSPANANLPICLCTISEQTSESFPALRKMSLIVI